MRRAHIAQQIVLPTDDLRGSLLAQIDALRRALGKTRAVIDRSVNKQFGVTAGLEALDVRQLGSVLYSLEKLIRHEEERERVREACADCAVTVLALGELLEIHFEGRDLGQLALDELVELRVLVEAGGSRSVAHEQETPAEVVM